MRNPVTTAGKVYLFVLMMTSAAVAQSRLQSGPAPAVAGPAYDVSVGYSYLSMPIGSAGRASMNGLDFSGNVALGPRWGVTLDSSYSRTSNVLSTPHQGYALTFLTGPVFSVVRHGNTRVFLRGLGGAGLIDGGVPVTDTSYFHGWLFRPAYAVGAGFEHPVSERLGVRVVADYLRTTFYDATGAAQGQGNLRITVSAVFRLKERRHRYSQLR